MFDHILPTDLVADLYHVLVFLVAISMRTSKLRFGPMVAPTPSRSPWNFAGEMASLDRSSGGRLTLSVGIGGPSSREFGSFGETISTRVRGEMVDEALQILERLWWSMMRWMISLNWANSSGMRMSVPGILIGMLCAPTTGRTKASLSLTFPITIGTDQIRLRFSNTRNVK